MNRLVPALVFLAMAQPAAAHGFAGPAPQTMSQGLLAGLGHPLIGVDHFGAILAVGCLAGWQRHGVRLIAGYLLALIAGAALHSRGLAVPGAEFAVALSVLVLGGAVLRPLLDSVTALALFVVAGLANGYSLGAPLAGAAPAPLAAYFLGLVIIQLAVALAAMAIVRALARDAPDRRVRLIGALVVGIGLAALAKEVLLAA